MCSRCGFALLSRLTPSSGDRHLRVTTDGRRHQCIAFCRQVPVLGLPSNRRQVRQRPSDQHFRQLGVPRCSEDDSRANPVPSQVLQGQRAFLGRFHHACSLHRQANNECGRGRKNYSTNPLWCGFCIRAFNICDQRRVPGWILRVVLVHTRVELMLTCDLDQVE